MKKSLIFAATAAVVLSACAKVDTYKVSEQEAVSFGVYAGKAASKAVSGTDYGTVTTTSLQAAASKGFGVFGYYTDADDYASNTKANFMYNQQVTYSGSAWTYSPVKYWPNEHGNKAVSTDVDKLTFLAYAPFVANKDIAGDKGVSITDKAGSAAADEGITAMTANNVAGDAVLTFKVPASAEEQIDLLYGVLNAQYNDVQDRPTGTVDAPLENLTKQKTGDKIQIKFKHALAKIAIDIKDVVDKDAPTTTVDPASDGTKVVVESLTLKGTIGTDGKLNLYTGAWSDTATGASFDVTPLPTDIYSGATAPTTYPTVDGVKETGLGTGKTIDLMVVPAAGAKITDVEIIYYICTKDSQLDGGVSIVKNVISKELGTAITIEQGKQYGLNVLLGLTSIKLDATVKDWDDSAADTNVDLPKNVA